MSDESFGSARRLKGMCVPISEIRTVCANERPHGSVRGVPGNRHPYRDPIARLRAISSQPLRERTRNYL